MHRHTTPPRRRRLALWATTAAALVLTAGLAGRAGAVGPTPDWSIDLDPDAAGVPLPTALLGHYDLSGALFDYDEKPGLAAAMTEVGFSDWRVGVGRWEAGTWLLPTLTDGTPCPIAFSESAAPFADDLGLIAARDWFSDDGSTVQPADTLDDSRYRLAYLRSVLDVVDDFGATPFVSIDSMPRALAVERTPERTDCGWTFQNRVSNVRPADPGVFALAAAGLVQRIVEGDATGPARTVTHWEVWNEPEFPQFWDPAYESPAGSLDHYFEMAIQTLFALDDYRASSSHPNAAALRFGLGSFATAPVAATTLTSFDAATLPAGPIPLDFLSFHAYSDDPLVVVAAIESVAAAAASTSRYADVELALAEWGPNLASSAGDSVYATSIQPALHVATVLALGATAGLDRAHRAIFWNFYPSAIQLGLLAHDMTPRPAYHAYQLLARMIVDGAVRLTPAGFADGRLDGGSGAVLTSRDPAGVRRVLLVNRNASDRLTHVRWNGSPASPTRLLVYDDPSASIVETPGGGPDILVPANALVLVEFAPPAVPTLERGGLALLAGALLGVTSSALRRRRGRRQGAA